MEKIVQKINTIDKRIKNLSMRNKKIRATHEGKLKLGDSELDVAVLENGDRVITQAAVFKALDRPVRGTTRVINLPTFMDAKNLKPFISSELEGCSKSSLTYQIMSPTTMVSCSKVSVNIICSEATPPTQTFV